MPNRVPASRKQTWSWQLKIELLGVTPSVWRRIIVPETIKLPKPHTVFQIALGWTNSHLHEFVIGGVRYADPDPDFADELEHVDQKNVVLVIALGIDSRCFDYVYDFGDDWHHIVIVEEQIPDRDFAPSLVHCSGGANCCPPEDVRSTRGYAEFPV
jgi:Plasmid pRiA4b ORF-3-like protein